MALQGSRSASTSTPCWGGPPSLPCGVAEDRENERQEHKEPHSEGGHIRCPTGVELLALLEISAILASLFCQG